MINCVQERSFCAYCDLVGRHISTQSPGLVSQIYYPISSFLFFSFLFIFVNLIFNIVIYYTTVSFSSTILNISKLQKAQKVTKDTAARGR